MNNERSLYYDMQGRPIDMMEWAAQFNDSEKRRVSLYENKWVRISTVHLGLDHGFGMGRPVIFETMVFPRVGPLRPLSELDMERYCTLAQAKAGHLDMVEKWGGWRGAGRLAVATIKAKLGR